MGKKEQIDYQNRYIAEKYDRFTATFPSGKKEVYRKYAESLGESLNALINRLLEEEIMKSQQTEI